LRWFSIKLNNLEARIQVADPSRGSGNGKVSKERMSIGNTSGGERGRKPSDLSRTEQLLNCVPKHSRRSITECPKYLQAQFEAIFAVKDVWLTYSRQ
jgi:hypothetical protein